MPSVSSPPAVSLKDIIEQEQCQVTSNVDPVTEVCPFVFSSLDTFYQERMTEEYVHSPTVIGLPVKLY